MADDAVDDGQPLCAWCEEPVWDADGGFHFEPEAGNDQEPAAHYCSTACFISSL